MNYFKCKECKKAVSYFETECSYCGAKKNKLSLLLVLVLVIILLLYVTANYLI